MLEGWQNRLSQVAGTGIIRKLGSTIYVTKTESGERVNKGVEKRTFSNPYSEKRKVELASLSEEQRKAIDSFFSLPKEERYIKPIKRKMKPDVKAGDVFAMQLPEGLFLYGKIIKKAENLPMIEDGCYIALVANVCTEQLEEIELQVNDSNLLLGPWIVSEAMWKSGKFYTVGNSPVTEDKLSIGFYKSKLVPDPTGKLYEAGYFVNLNGDKMNEEPDIFTLCAYITIDGIEHEIYEQRIRERYHDNSRTG